MSLIHINSDNSHPTPTWTSQLSTPFSSKGFSMSSSLPHVPSRQDLQSCMGRGRVYPCVSSLGLEARTRLAILFSRKGSFCPDRDTTASIPLPLQWQQQALPDLQRWAQRSSPPSSAPWISSCLSSEFLQVKPDPCPVWDNSKKEPLVFAKIKSIADYLK